MADDQIILKDNEHKFSFKDIKLPKISKFPKIPLAIIIILILAAVMFATAKVRWGPLDVPVTNTWAKNAVYNNIYRQAYAEQQAQYPNLPAATLETSVKQKVDKIYVDQAATIKASETQTAAYFKSQLQDDQGTYLLEIDPNQHLQRIQNYLRTGMFCDIFKNGLCLDMHKQAPIGEQVDPEFHLYFSVAVIKLVQIFDPNVIIRKVFFLVPVILACLCTIPTFFIVRKKAGLFGGAVAAFVVGTATFFVERTPAGFADTDGYTVLFPLLIMWFFFEATETDKILNKVIFAALAGVSVGLFAYAWSGWWFILFAAIGALVINAIFQAITDKSVKPWKNKQVINTIIILAAFFIAAAIVISILMGPNFIIYPIKAAMTRLTITTTATNKEGFWEGASNLWPNVYTTVAELHRTSVQNLLPQIGPALLVIIALAGIIFLFFREDEQLSWVDLSIIGGSLCFYALIVAAKVLQDNVFIFMLLLIIPPLVAAFLRRKKDNDLTVALLLLLMFVGSVFASTRGVRFLLLFVPPYALLVGVSFGRIVGFVKGLKMNKILSTIAVLLTIIVLCLLLIKPAKDSLNTSQNRGPEISDAWVQSLQAINTSSQPDAIINSWWDWGHWFKYWGNRGVTFDGASQNSPMAYFIGKVLATEDEHEAIGILRMLDCGSYKAFAYTQKEFGDDTVLTDKWLSELVKMNRTEAEKAIADKRISRQPPGMADDKVLQNINRSTDLLGLTHCDPPEDYFVTSQDMVGKAGVWGHFGLWDFTRAYISVHKNDGDILDVLTKKYSLSVEEAGGLVAEAQGLVGVDDINAWISPWPGYVTGANCNTENNITSCPLNVDIGGGTLTNFVINGTTTTLYAQVINNVGATATAVVNVNAVYLDGVKQLSNTSSVVLPYDIVYSQDKIVMCSEQLSNSIFTKLFFFNGEGTTHFEKFHEATTIAGEKIIIWKVKW